MSWSKQFHLHKILQFNYYNMTILQYLGSGELSQNGVSSSKILL